MKIKRFEDIEAWGRARELTKCIYKVSSINYFSKDWGLRDQIRKSSISVMSNIAEGFDSISRMEFSRFLGIARRSVSEIQSQLYIALDQGYVTENEFNSFYNEAEEIRKMITSFIKYLRSFQKFSNSMNS